MLPKSRYQRIMRWLGVALFVIPTICVTFLVVLEVKQLNARAVEREHAALQCEQDIFCDDRY